MTHQSEIPPESSESTVDKWLPRVMLFCLGGAVYVGLTLSNPVAVGAFTVGLFIGGALSFF